MKSKPASAAPIQPPQIARIPIVVPKLLLSLVLFSFIACSTLLLVWFWFWFWFGDLLVLVELLEATPGFTIIVELLEATPGFTVIVELLGTTPVCNALVAIEVPVIVEVTVIVVVVVEVIEPELEELKLLELLLLEAKLLAFASKAEMKASEDIPSFLADPSTLL